MKRVNLLAIILMVLTVIPFSAFAREKVFNALGTNKLDVATKIQVGGFWADNWTFDNKIATQVSKNSFVITLYPKKEEAWNYYCKINLKDFAIPDKKAIKEHQKDKKDFVFACDIEFFYNVEYPSLEECFANYGGFEVNSKDNGAKKRNITGSIGLSPFFFTAGDKFDKGDVSEMIMMLVIDESALGVYLLDHLKF